MKDLHLILREITEVMKEAGKVISDVTALHVSEKSGHADLVTEYDVYVQRFLMEKLALIDPDAKFMGEEEDQQKDLDADELFIIDPIDGTANFVYDYHHSCISVALKRGGEVQLAAVYQPWDHAMYTAIKGEGAYCNGVRLHVMERKMRDCMINFGTAPYYEGLRNRTIRIIDRLMDRVQDVRRRGSAVLDLCDAAAGRCGAFFELRLCPWDYAAGGLLVTEAGGVITDENGEPVSLKEKCSVVAGSPEICRELLQMMKEIE